MHKSIISLFVLATVISLANAGFWDSLVNVDRQDNGDRKVGVHLPFIYWMDLNRNKNGPKLDISVLGGLVKVNVDRNNDPGKRPVMVRLLGQKIYNSYPKGMMPTYSQQQTNYDSAQYQNEVPKDAANVKPNDAIVAQESHVTNSNIALEPTSSPAYDVPPSVVSSA